MDLVINNISQKEKEKEKAWQVIVRLLLLSQRWVCFWSSTYTLGCTPRWSAAFRHTISGEFSSDFLVSNLGYNSIYQGFSPFWQTQATHPSPYNFQGVEGSQTSSISQIGQPGIHSTLGQTGWVWPFHLLTTILRFLFLVASDCWTKPKGVCVVIQGSAYCT